MTNIDITTFSHIVDEIVNRQINIAPSRSEWVSLAYQFASLGEDGRDLFHRCSALDSTYSFGDSEKIFSYALSRGNRTGVGALLNTFRKHGIDTSSVAASAFSTSRTRMTNNLCKYNPIPISVISALQGKPSTFTDFLLTLFTEEQVTAAVERYRLGGDSHQRAVFPCLLNREECVGGAVIPYLSNGRRDKSSHLSTIHTELNKKNPSQPSQGDVCLFGLHLLDEHPEAVVGIVEAQKTAIMMSITAPNLVWLATCGKQNLNSRSLPASIYQRKVILFPDVDGREEWERRMKELPFINATISKWWELSEGSKEDIADVVVRQLQTTKDPYIIPPIVQQLFPDNTAINKLCRMLQLEVVLDEEWQEPQPLKKFYPIYEERMKRRHAAKVAK